MFADDRAVAPMTFFLRFRFSGELNLAFFEAAAWQAQQRHRFTRQIIAGCAQSTTDQLRWLPAQQPHCHISVSEGDAPFPDFPAGHPTIDITREVGLRFFVQQQDGGPTILMQVHHSASDALGAVSIMEDLLTAYDALARGRSTPNFKPLDETLLDHRDTTVVGSAQTLECGVGKLSAAIRSLKRPAEPIKTDPPLDDFDCLASQPFPASRSVTLSPDQSKQLVRRAAQAGATVNDVLLCDLIVALNSCYDQINVARLAIPVDLRTPDFAAMPAANAVGITFLDLPLANARTNPDLLAQIAARTRAIKDESAATSFCQALEMAGRFRGSLTKFTSSNHCYCTALLSNLVRPFANSQLAGDDELVRSGGLVMTECELLPPVRPLTSAAFGVVTYGDCTYITLNYDSRAMDAAEADRLLAAFATSHSA